MPKQVTASVGALNDVSLSGLGRAQLDRSIMQELQARVEELVLIDNGRGAPIAVRIGEPHDEPETIRLDRFARRALKAGLGARVELIRCVGHEAETVVLRPMGLSSPDIANATHVHRMLEASGAPVSAGGVLHVRFREGTAAGMPYLVQRVVPGPGWVGEDTRIRIEQHDGGWGEPEIVGFEDVGGLDEQIESLRELVQLPLQRPEIYRELGITPPRGVILHGPPGTGKTRLVHALAGDVQASYSYVNGPEIVGQTYGEGESRLRTVFDDAVRASPSIIFIDELDALAPQRGVSGSQSDARLVGQLLALLDGLREAEGLMVVATTNRIEAIDRACRRAGRFDREVFIGPPSLPGRRDILEIQSREMPLSPAARESLDEVARRAIGYVGADLMDLCREAALAALRRHVSSAGGAAVALQGVKVPVTIEAEDFVTAFAGVKPAIERATSFSVGTRWSELAEVGKTEQAVLEMARHRLDETRGRPGIRTAEQEAVTGICLHGASGAGKTSLAEAVADRCSVPLFVVRSGDVFQKWLGDSEARLRDVFHAAAQFAPAVILLDHLEIIAPVDAATSGHPGAARVLTQLQLELDEVADNILVIATVEDLASVHPSVLRRGRLGTHVSLSRSEQT